MRKMYGMACLEKGGMVVYPSSSTRSVAGFGSVFWSFPGHRSFDDSDLGMVRHMDATQVIANSGSPDSRRLP